MTEGRKMQTTEEYVHCGDAAAWMAVAGTTFDAEPGDGYDEWVEGSKFEEDDLDTEEHGWVR